MKAKEIAQALQLTPRQEVHLMRAEIGLLLVFVLGYNPKSMMGAAVENLFTPEPDSKLEEGLRLLIEKYQPKKPPT